MTHDTAALRALLARVEGAESEDRELDLAIAKLVVPDVVVLRRENGENVDYTYWKYTASIDAAVALAERVLPGWIWLIKNGSPNLGESPFAYITEDSPENMAGRSMGATVPLALVAAILKVLIAEGEAK